MMDIESQESEDTDSHLLPEEKYPDATEPSLIGDPGTYIYATSLGTEALKEGIQAGHAVISRDGFIEYKVKGEALLAGDALSTKSGVLEVACERNAPTTIQWIVDGKIVKEDAAKTSNMPYDFEDDSYHWVRVDVRDENGQFIGATNPFYWGEKPTKLETWGDAIDEWNRQKSNTV